MRSWISFATMLVVAVGVCGTGLLAQCAEGRIFLQDTEIELEGLVPRLNAITANNPDVRIFVRGDKRIEYGRVMEIMGTVNAAGYRKVALVTDRLKQRRRKAEAR